MTDRDYFAASALNALMVTAVEEEQWEICECAFAWADAMLEARDSRPAKPEATVDPDLRNNLRLCRDMVEQLRAEKAADWKAACESAELASKEINRLRLTDEEREAILAMACHCDTRAGLEWHKYSATLRLLLERMK